MKAFIVALFLFCAVAFSTVQAGDIECGVCTYLVGAVETYVSNNATETEILSFLEKDCDLLGVSDWVTVCKGTIATFGPEIINLVIEKEPADVVCSEIGLCNSTSSISLLPKYNAGNLGNGTIECDLCQFVVNEVEKLLAANQTETEIIDGLQDACGDLPITSWASACSALVKQYGYLIIQYVENEPSDKVCDLISLCDDSSNTTPAFNDKMKLQKF